MEVDFVPDRFAEAARAAGFPAAHIHDAAYSMKTAVYIARRLAKRTAAWLRPKPVRLLPNDCRQKWKKVSKYSL